MRAPGRSSAQNNTIPNENARIDYPLDIGTYAVGSAKPFGHSPRADLLGRVHAIDAVCGRMPTPESFGVHAGVTVGGRSGGSISIHATAPVARDFGV